jgi:hypothetical protein
VSKTLRRRIKYRLAINGGMKVRVMVVVPFLVGERKQGSVHSSLPCVAAHGDKGAAERHKTGHLGVGGRAIERRRRMVGRARRDGDVMRIGTSTVVGCGHRLGMARHGHGEVGTTTERCDTVHAAQVPAQRTGTWEHEVLARGERGSDIHRLHVDEDEATRLGARS